jgi:peptide/nickel transport system substrate-binding protein
VRKLIAMLAVAGLVATATLGLASCGQSGGKEGGTLTGSYAGFPDYLDPALSYTAEGWTAMYDTYLPLLTYAHASGTAGSKVIPGLVKAMPKITNGGKTYTMDLQPGLEYSDGTPIKASDFTKTLERTLKLNSPGTPFYTDIVGAEKFAETKTGGIPGIETNDKTGHIVINLTRPRGTFNFELGLLFVAPLPPGTPAKNLSASPPPASGPYEITKSEPGRGWEYERNPAWTKTNGKVLSDLPAGHVDKIDITVVRNDSTQVNEIEQNRTNWMQTPPPADRYAEVKSKYEGTQFRVEPTISTYYFWMNMKKPPFDDLKVRQAVNYAINTDALERIYSGQLAATHQILPPSMPGYKKYDLYPYNLGKAEALIKEANPSDRDITVWTDNESPNDEAGAYYADVLEKLGFNVSLKTINADSYFTVVGNLSTPDLDTGWIDWYEDYPHPNDFFQPLLAAESIFPTNNTNVSLMEDSKLDAKVAKLREEEFGPEQEAQYAKLDREYMEQAPWAPYGNKTVSTFVDDEIDLDKVIYNPTFGHDLTSFQFIK